MLDEHWDLMVAHPPCRYLANSGSRWLWDANGSENIPRWDALEQAVLFFRLLADAVHIPRIAIENPIPHGYAAHAIGRKFDQTIQPYQFGHLETKRTCLWLKGVPPLLGTHDVRAEMRLLPDRLSNKVHHAVPSADRWKDRSRSYPGIAAAMAAQWGGA
jgi:hypothetical protein